MLTAHWPVKGSRRGWNEAGLIASFPMYDRPETAEANNRLWAAISENLADAPKALTRNGDVWDHWADPGLVLSQTCGYPYRAKLVGKVQLVATPVYEIDCAPGCYYSVFVARKNDTRSSPEAFANASFAYNEALSQSGWAAPQNHAAKLGFRFSNTTKSGAHTASARQVAEGQADIAALDAVSWAMMQRWDGFAKELKVLDKTDPTPGLPLITSLGRDPAPIRAAVARAIEQMPDHDRDDLCLTGLTDVSEQGYLDVPNPASP